VELLITVYLTTSNSSSAMIPFRISLFTNTLACTMPIIKIQNIFNMALSEVTPETEGDLVHIDYTDKCEHQLKVHKHKSRHPLAMLTSEDVNCTSIQFHKLKVAEVICCGLACLGFVCGAISYDLSYNESILEDKKDVFEAISLTGTVSTIFLSIAIYWRTIKELRWEQARGACTKNDNLLTTGKIHILILELLLNLVHPLYWLGSETFPFHNERYQITSKYTYNGILCFISLIRVYHIIRLISILSKFRSSRAQRVCKINGTSASTMYAIKCLMKDTPIKAFLILLIVGIVLFAFCLRIFERPMSHYTGDPGMDFSYFENAMWCVVLIMTTVGYGDYFPVTEPGRVIGFIACLWGVLVVSMVVITLSNMLSLESGENKAFIMLSRLQYKKDLREKAASLVGAAVRFRLMSISDHPDEKKLKSQAAKFRRYLSSFKKTRSQMRCLYDLDSVQDRLERSMVTILEENEKIHQRLASTSERLKILNSLLTR
jgi:hypothetical protein